MRVVSDAWFRYHKKRDRESRPPPHNIVPFQPLFSLRFVFRHPPFEKGARQSCLSESPCSSAQFAPVYEHREPYLSFMRVLSSRIESLKTRFCLCAGLLFVSFGPFGPFYLSSEVGRLSLLSLSL